MNIFIDTNIFLRYILADDPVQSKDCERVLQLTALKKEVRWYTGTVVLAEVIWTMISVYGLSKNDGTRAVRSILALPRLRVIDDYNPRVAIDLYSQYSVKYVDAIIASIFIAKSTFWKILSYDKDFDRLEIDRAEPRELLKKS